MALSASTNYLQNRDQLITRALRIVNEIGTEETPRSGRVTECAQVLNDIFKEWESLGMQLWKQSTIQLTPLTAGTASYTIGVGSTFNMTPPLKILDVYKRYTATGADSPLILITKREYDLYNTKSVSGTITQVYYNPPGSISATENQGTIYFVGPPDASFVAACSHIPVVTVLVVLVNRRSSTIRSRNGVDIGIRCKISGRRRSKTQRTHYRIRLGYRRSYPLLGGKRTRKAA